MHLVGFIISIGQIPSLQHREYNSVKIRGLSFGAESFIFQFAIRKRLRYTELQFCLLFFMGMKLGRSL